MIGGCITSGKYNMTASLYRKTSSQNANTGQVKSEYVFDTEFPLIARGLANLRGKDSGTLQDYGNKLDEYHYLRVKTMQHMEEGDVITRIIDAGGQVYLDYDIQFIVIGITPTYEPFGTFMEYDIICNKSEVHVKIVDNAISTGDSVTVTGL